MLEETELREEQLKELKLLVQSPGWVLFRNRLRERLQHKEREKAGFLLAGKLHEAVIVQGYINGLSDYERIVEDHMSKLKVEVSEEKPY